MHNDSLDRQVTEGVNVANFGGDVLMNRRGEFGAVRIERQQYRRWGANKKKTNGGSFYYQKGRRSQREMEGTDGDQSPQSLTAAGGHPSKNYHGGVVDLVSIFLITRISGISGGTPALWLPAGIQKC